MDIKLVTAVDSDNDTVNDLYLENGTVRLTADIKEEVAQELSIRFQSFKGEWFLDPTAGIPYFQSILGLKVPTAIVSQILRSVITGCPGVSRLDTFTMSQDTGARFSSVSFTCTLLDGTILVSSDFGQFIVPS